MLTAVSPPGRAGPPRCQYPLVVPLARHLLLFARVGPAPPRCAACSRLRGGSLLCAPLTPPGGGLGHQARPGTSGRRGCALQGPDPGTLVESKHSPCRSLDHAWWRPGICCCALGAAALPPHAPQSPPEPLGGPRPGFPFPAGETEAQSRGNCNMRRGGNPGVLKHPPPSLQWGDPGIQLCAPMTAQPGAEGPPCPRDGPPMDGWQCQHLPLLPQNCPQQQEGLECNMAGQ